MSRFVVPWGAPAPAEVEWTRQRRERRKALLVFLGVTRRSLNTAARPWPEEHWERCGERSSSLPQY